MEEERGRGGEKHEKRKNEVPLSCAQIAFPEQGHKRPPFPEKATTQAFRCKPQSLYSRPTEEHL